MSTSSRILGFCDALAAALNAAQPAPPATTPFAAAFTAVRRVLPVVDLAKLGPGVQVSVIPVGAEEVRDGRLAGVFTVDLEVDVLVQQKLQPTDDPDVLGATLLELLEQIRDFFKVGGVGTVAGVPTWLTAPGASSTGLAAMTKCSASPSYSMPGLLDKRCFIGVQTFTFRLFV